jgi:hypothetical protein
VRSRKYGDWSCELEFHGKLEICKLQIWSSLFLTVKFGMITKIAARANVSENNDDEKKENKFCNRFY